MAHILEGSVRKAGNRIRVTAQLIQASDGFHLFSKTYDRDLTDVFAVQDDLAALIGKALQTELTGEDDIPPALHKRASRPMTTICWLVSACTRVARN